MMKGGSAAPETAKLSGEDFNLFRGVFNASCSPIRRFRRPRRVPQFASRHTEGEGVTDAPGVVMP